MPFPAPSSPVRVLPGPRMRSRRGRGCLCLRELEAVRGGRSLPAEEAGGSLGERREAPHASPAAPLPSRRLALCFVCAMCHSCVSLDITLTDFLQMFYRSGGELVE